MVTLSPGPLEEKVNRTAHSNSTSTAPVLLLVLLLIFLLVLLLVIILVLLLVLLLVILLGACFFLLREGGGLIFKIRRFLLSSHIDRLIGLPYVLIYELVFYVCQIIFALCIIIS